MISITKEFAFDSAHYLPEYDGKCSRLHGHTYKLEVTVTGDLWESGPKEGMILDFADLDQTVRATVIDKVDHQLLNDILPGRPTAENLAKTFFETLSLVLIHCGVKLVRLRLWETPTAYVEVSE